MTLSNAADTAILIGRFQPFHNGHAGLLQTALASAPKVLVVLGSSFHARSPKNPFTWEERAAMIRATLSEADRARVGFLPVRDYYDDVRWAEAVRTAVASECGDAAPLVLVAHFKDASSYYLNHFPHWEMVDADSVAALDATRIRRLLFESDNIDVALSVLDDSVPLGVRQYLKAWLTIHDIAALVEEHRMVERYKRAWKSAPYPPIFVTVDALVVSAGCVLLIRRGGHPGKGLWALPGGFVEQDERLLAGAMRELHEETSIAMLDSSLAAALVAVQVFDHPDRSQRGRTITHVHHFDLRSDFLPEVQAADDAALARWVPFAELVAMELAFFEDHFNILDHFFTLSAGVDVPVGAPA